MIIKAFRNDSMSEAQINVWYRFKDGQEPAESDPRSGRPATSRTPENVKHVQAAINENQQVTVWWQQNLSCKLLLQEHKKFHAEVAQDSLETSNNDPQFLKPVITRDYDPETKAQSSQWKSPKSPHRKKAQQSWTNVKTMLMVSLS
jgi:hypothetical protein